MEAIDRIASADWPALQAWARLHEWPVEAAAESFEDEFLGEWPNLEAFARDRVQWEHNLPNGLMPFFNTKAYMDARVYGPDSCFLTIGFAGGVWVFQTAPEPDWWNEPDVPTKDPLGDPE